MKKSEKILRTLSATPCLGRTVEERLTILEYFIEEILDNELTHIWLILKLILGGVISVLAGVIVQIILKR
jgi:hypothetical protein